MSLVEKIDKLKDVVGFDQNGIGMSGVLNAEQLLAYGNGWASFIAYTAASVILYCAVENFVDAVDAYSRAKKNGF